MKNYADLEGCWPWRITLTAHLFLYLVDSPDLHNSSNNTQPQPITFSGSRDRNRSRVTMESVTTQKIS